MPESITGASPGRSLPSPLFPGAQGRSGADSLVPIAGRLDPITRRSVGQPPHSAAGSQTDGGAPLRRPPPRVLPLLCEDLKTRPATHQRMNLITFREHWADVQRVSVTKEDARELLLLLFVLANDPNRRQGVSEYDTRRLSAVAQLSFETLHMLFTDPHPHFKTFVLGLKQLMRDLHCDEEHFYARPVPSAPPDNYEQMRSELEKEWQRERDRRRAGQEEAAAEGAPAVTAGEDAAATAVAGARQLVSDAEGLCQATDTESGGGPTDPEARELQERLGQLERLVSNQLQPDLAVSEREELLRRKTALPSAERAADLLQNAREVLSRAEAAQQAQAEAAEQGPPPAPAEDEEVPEAGAPAEPEEAEEERPPPEWAAVLPVQSEPPPVLTIDGPLDSTMPTAFVAEHLRLDSWLQQSDTRPFAVQLMRCWDYSGIIVHYFVEGLNKVHLYLPYLYSSRTKVYRDFICCTQRPPIRSQWATPAHVHIKTNIPARSDIMYRFLVEGYNYGNNAIIHSDIAGYTHRQWRRLGRGAMEEAGWPEGWDDDMSNSYTHGCTIDQYYSSDGYVVVVLEARSFFCVGFSVSAWLVVHGFGAGFELTASIHHQDARL
eukprot:TRINITY_DN55145_c0_g1_i1.p1 TRINITY_DN55145_c0_g1~~TRINITY_DN55145_c0_g1_i1.p1  ORF type:complete len:636 (+),score=240.42 TRINITY_DN55145_c0_g1_i1:91-1908(+)